MSAVIGSKPARRNIGPLMVMAFLGLCLLAQVLFADKPWWLSALAILLLVTSLYPTVRYFAYREAGLPTAAVFGIVYALQFVVPVFSKEAEIELVTGVNQLRDADVRAAIIMATMGIIALFAGYYTSQRGGFRRVVPIARLPLSRQKAILFCAIVTAMLPVTSLLQDTIPVEYRITVSAITRLLYAQALVAIGILGWIVYSQRSRVIYTIWLYGLVAAMVAQGIAKGVLEEVVVPLAVIFVIRWLYAGRLAVWPATVVVAIMIFLSPVKADFREEAWFGTSASLSGVAKAGLWVGMATDFWAETLSGVRDIDDATARFVSRTDLIHQLAHIHELTPAIVPYQYGETYGYFAVALIPRLFWPEKPEAGDANYFFATNYGLTTEEGARRSTFGVSLVGEAYINFGWLGIAALMFTCGLVLGILQYSFGEKHSGAGGQAIFLAFFVFFLNGMGTSAEIMFGNIVQNVVAGYVLLMWARQREVASNALLEPRWRPH